MRTHPKIKALLARTDLSDGHREAVKLADGADKASRAYHGPGSSYAPTYYNIIGEAHADLIKHDCPFINNMAADVWLMRLARELCSLPRSPFPTNTK